MSPSTNRCRPDPGVLFDQETRSGLEKSTYQIELYSEYLGTTLFPVETSQRYVPAIGRGTPLGVGMRERVQQLHGVFDIESAPGRRTTVRAVLSIPHESVSSSADGEALEQLKIAKVPPRSEAKRAGSDG